MGKKREGRIMPTHLKGGGLVRFMASADGYVMVRRPTCAPFIVSNKDWLSWPLDEGQTNG
ncbi:hypothetical protein [Novosphingobium sp. FKTRR1]|uniref:hypothetical protein n=1 Tax=Novosphingobium sp. FKTRR1 TaxID=2879118 RepID=UPI001CF08199|nr:hypothetical protein [Novosphingobium sp. FKTRR1]